MAAYGRLCTLFHDAAAPPVSDAEIDGYAGRLPRDAGPALVAMCGSGRLLVALLQRGCNVHGVDASPARIAACEARLAAAGLAAPLFRQDVAALNLPLRYAAAIVAAGSFQRLADSIAAQAALERIRAHLVAPGLLLMEFRVPAEAAHAPGAPLVHVQSVSLPDGTRIACRSETTVDADARRIAVRSRYERRERGAIVAREDETVALTWYGEDEAVALLADAGFRDIGVGPPGEPGTEGERRFAVSARV
jgi:SAM-dependent methyltransferase